jgi:hypothetical protein
MARNIETGIKRTIAAKLREGGKSEAEADSLADAHASEGLAYFKGQVAVHSEALGGMEASYDLAFRDLSAWAGALA